MQLSSFIVPPVAAAISRASALADRRDGVGGGRLPNYAAGCSRRGWSCVGPPQLQRYLRHRGSKRAHEAKGVGQLMQARFRRFRPGLDYTLAHVGSLRDKEVLEASLCFVDSSQSSLEQWDSGEIGGFECFVSAANEELTAAEVYRADASSEVICTAWGAGSGVTSIHAMNNSLALCLRAPGTMKFVKYVSASAPGSRWDVASEYSVA
ncbi:MAG: hypothetical protein SGPRY_010225 [Prymnesium sp.]